MAKKKPPSSGGFNFEEFADDEGIRKARDMAEQQANYRSL